MTLAFDETARALRVRIEAHERYSTLKLEDVLAQRLATLALGNVLDAGCGSGNFSPVLAARARGACVGMDKSAALLVEAVARCRRAHVPRTVFVRSDIDQPLPFAARQFDLALFAYSAYYTDSADRLLGEVARVLTASGRVLLVGPALGNASELDVLSERIFGVSASPEKSVRVSRLESEFLPVLRRLWGDTVHDRLDCSLVFPDTWAYVAYYKATPQFLELVAAHGLPDEGRIAASIERLPAPRVTKKIVLLQATRPAL